MTSPPTERRRFDRRTGLAGQAVAAALRHYERARLVGVAPDPGDGHVTTDFLLSDGYPLRIETGVLLRPSGQPASSEPLVVDVDDATCGAADTLDPCREAVGSAQANAPPHRRIPATVQG